MIDPSISAGCRGCNPAGGNLLATHLVEIGLQKIRMRVVFSVNVIGDAFGFRSRMQKVLEGLD